MAVTAKNSSSRQQKLAQARLLSDSVTKKTVCAGITHVQLKKDTQKAFNDIRSNRSNRN